MTNSCSSRLAFWIFPLAAHVLINELLLTQGKLDGYVLVFAYSFLYVVFLGGTMLLRSLQRKRPSQVGKWFLLLSGVKVFISVLFLAIVLSIKPMDSTALVLHFMLPYLYFQHLQLFAVLKLFSSPGGR